MMKAFYYYYYLFYKKILLDPDPHLATTLGITALEALLVNCILNIVLAYFFCWDLTKYYMLGIVVLILLANTFYFFSSEKAKEIVKSKPILFNSHRFSIVFILLFSILVISTLFWTGDYVNRIIDHCH
jgi:hypothetical protein